MNGIEVFLVRIVEAAVLGGAIGLERELSGKPAGLRTNMLICVGAAVLTQLSIAVAATAQVADPARIAAQIVSGIGFLGAGTILQSRHAVHGLTSAAVIWVVAALGMVAGAGLHVEAAVATGVVLVALILLGKIEKWAWGQHTVTVTVHFTGTPPTATEIMRRAGLSRRLVRSRHRANGGGGGTLALTWRGAESDASAVADAAGSLDGVEVGQWEFEE